MSKHDTRSPDSIDIDRCEPYCVVTAAVAGVWQYRHFRLFLVPQIHNRPHPLGNMNNATCGLVLDRHVPKTAGTTVRTMLRQNAKLGNCEYVGYDLGRTWASRVGFNHRSLADLVGELRITPVPHRRLCAEAHMVAATFWSDLTVLRTAAFARTCRVVVMVRVREPLAWYISFFDWAVRPRQRTGNARWGANFTDWLPYNMQSRYLLHGAGVSSEWADDLAAKAGPSAPRRLDSGRWAQLEQLLRATDVVAPLERLDDSLAVVMHLAGFLSTIAYERTAPHPVRGPWDRQPQVLRVQSAAKFCAEAPHRHCLTAVRAAAADDYRLYALALELFEGVWRRHGIEATRARDAAGAQMKRDAALRSGRHSQRGVTRVARRMGQHARRRGLPPRTAGHFSRPDEKN